MWLGLQFSSDKNERTHFYYTMLKRKSQKSIKILLRPLYLARKRTPVNLAHAMHMCKQWNKCITKTKGVNK